QAEDGIRDRNVTGVQTCALPILLVVPVGGGAPAAVAKVGILVALAIGEQDCTTLTSGHQLAVLEAEGGDPTQLPGMAAAPARSVRVCGVVQYLDPGRLGQRVKCVHVGELAGHVYSHDHLRARPDGRGGRVDVEAVGVEVDVGGYRHGTQPLYGERARDEGERGDDHFVTRPDVHARQGDLQRCGPTAHGQAVRCAVALGEGALEVLH